MKATSWIDIGTWSDNNCVKREIDEIKIYVTDSSEKNGKKIHKIMLKGNRYKYGKVDTSDTKTMIIEDVTNRELIQLYLKIQDVLFNQID
jgi:hypothetical protein